MGGTSWRKSAGAAAPDGCGVMHTGIYVGYSRRAGDYGIGSHYGWRAMFIVVGTGAPAGVDRHGVAEARGVEKEGSVVDPGRSGVPSPRCFLPPGARRTS